MNHESGTYSSTCVLDLLKRSRILLFLQPICLHLRYISTKRNHYPLAVEAIRWCLKDDSEHIQRLI